MTKTTGITRRTFLAGSAGMAAAAMARPARAAQAPASERVRLGVIGCGGMGRAHIYALAQETECEIVALCDVYRKRYEEVLPNVENITGKRPDTYQDFRRVLDRQDIDAVFVVTPDHWHPLLTIFGCQAGKDVYVEKPVCPTIEEGRAMVTAARRYGRIVQVGTQQRSMPVFQEAMKIVHSGKLGQITSATAWIGTNGWNVGETPGPPPDDLDWDLWLGPAPYMPYSPQRQFGFMGWHDYARGGELTNWGVHLMDIVHWGIGQDRPLNVQAVGGSYRQAPGADNYETIEAIFEYPGCNVTWEQRHQNEHDGKGFGIMFQGTEGRLVVDRGTFKVSPPKLGIAEQVFEPETSWANPAHHHNFFESIRNRTRPAADIEQGFRSTAAVLLAGIALKTGRKLHWDGDAEQFTGDPQANRYLSRPYRAPWRL